VEVRCADEVRQWPSLVHRHPNGALTGSSQVQHRATSGTT
jgi:hypothetical protein